MSKIAVPNKRENYLLAKYYDEDDLNEIKAAENKVHKNLDNIADDYIGLKNMCEDLCKSIWSYMVELADERGWEHLWIRFNDLEEDVFINNADYGLINAYLSFCREDKEGDND